MQTIETFSPEKQYIYGDMVTYFGRTWLLSRPKNVQGPFFAGDWEPVGENPHLRVSRTWLHSIEAIDFYKVGHRFQMPKNTQFIFDTWTARSDKYLPKLDGIYDGRYVHCGIEGLVEDMLINHWEDTFFRVPAEEAVGAYFELLKQALGFEVPMEEIYGLHALGYLPIGIYSLPEGALVPIRVPSTTFESTGLYPWIVTYIETQWSNSAWHGPVVATLAYQYRKLLEQYADKTGASLDLVQWMGHDFSYRGMTSPYAAAGLAMHMSSFTGTDTTPAIRYLKAFYNADWDNAWGVIGGSVNATEHAVMCLGGQETEIETYKRLILEVHPFGILSIVSDTWDLWEVLTDYTVQLKEEILARDGKVVFRPDSGNPADILCGFDYLKVNHPELSLLEKGAMARTAGYEYFIDETGQGYKHCMGWGKRDDRVERVDARVIKGAAELLWDIFGGEYNAKGYRSLHEKVGLIYGDSITLELCREILERLERKQFISTTVVFGIGSFTYQYVTRDTLGFAMKTTAGIVDGEVVEVCKDPVTDDGMKKSAKGFVRVREVNGTYVMDDQVDIDERHVDSAMSEVFWNGRRTRFTSLGDMRRRLHG